MDVDKMCNGWCLPLYIYLAFTALNFVTALLMKQRIPGTDKFVEPTMNKRLSNAMTTLIFNLLIALLIYYLCKYCKHGWAWFVLFLPLILGFLLFITLMALVMIGHRNLIPLEPSNGRLMPLHPSEHDLMPLHPSDNGRLMPLHHV